MKALITCFARDEQGQDLIEYALLAAFVSLAVVAGATTLGDGLSAWFNDLGGTVSTFDSEP